MFCFKSDADGWPLLIVMISLLIIVTGIPVHVRHRSIPLQWPSQADTEVSIGLPVGRAKKTDTDEHNVSCQR